MKHNIILCGLMSFAASAHAAPLTVFSTDFNDTLATEITPGLASLTDVQGYAGLGTTGNTFEGNFLRSDTGNTVTLTLNNLPTHTSK